MTRTRRLAVSYLALAAALAVLFALNLFWGSVSLAPGAVLAALLGKGQDTLSMNIILQLRLRKGLSLDEYKKRYGRELSTAQRAFVQNCVKSGYASFDGRTLALTPAGLIVQNSILAQLL